MPAHPNTARSHNIALHMPILSLASIEPLYQHISYLESEAAYYERTSRYAAARSAYRDISATLAAIDDITSTTARTYAR